MKALQATGFTDALSAVALDARAFESFGDVLENTGPTRRRDFAGAFAGAPGTRPALWVNRLEPVHDTAICVDVMERHPYSPQTFVPFDAGRFLIALALSGDDGMPDLTTLRAFVSAGGQGVTYRTNVWHYAFTSLDTVMQVAVIQSASGHDDDTIVTRLAAPVRVTLSSSIAPLATR